MLLQELVKMFYKDSAIKSAPELPKVEKNAIFPLLLYYRWYVVYVMMIICRNKIREHFIVCVCLYLFVHILRVVRSIVDQSSSKLAESKTINE